MFTRLAQHCFFFFCCCWWWRCCYWRGWQKDESKRNNKISRQDVTSVLLHSIHSPSPIQLPTLLPQWERAQAWVTTTLPLLLLLLLVCAIQVDCPLGGMGNAGLYVSQTTPSCWLLGITEWWGKMGEGLFRMPSMYDDELQTFVVIRRRYKDSTNHFRVSTKRSVYVADFPNDGTLNREERHPGNTIGFGCSSQEHFSPPVGHSFHLNECGLER